MAFAVLPGESPEPRHPADSAFSRLARKHVQSACRYDERRSTSWTSVLLVFGYGVPPTERQDAPPHAPPGLPSTIVTGGPPVEGIRTNEQVVMA